MQKYNAALRVFLLAFYLFAALQAHDEKYPQDALTNTWIPVETAKIGLKEMRSAIRDKIDEQTNAKIAIDKCKALLNSGKVDIAALYKGLSKVIQNSHHTSDKGALLVLSNYKANFGTIIEAIDRTGMSVACTVHSDDISKIDALVNGLKSGDFENMPLYNDAYNRLSRSIKKDEEFRYSLAEAEVLGRDVPGLSEWYSSNKALIQKIKNNMVEVKNNTLVAKQTCGEEILCLYSHQVDGIVMPREISDIISKLLYKKNNPSKTYAMAGSIGEYLYCPQDSFDGLEPEITTGAQVSLLPPRICEYNKGFPTTQLWVRHHGNIRLSDDYNVVDIHCNASDVISLLAAEYSLRYLVGLYATQKKNIDKQADTTKLVFFGLNWMRRRYKKISSTKSTDETIIVSQRHYDNATQIFQTEEFDRKSLQFVGMDKINAQCLYSADRIFYQTLLHTFKPLKIEMPDQIIVKK